IQTLHERLGISSIEELKAAIEAGQLRQLPGFGEKTAQALLGKISSIETRDDNILLIHALRLATRIVEYLEAGTGWTRIDLAGAIRRWQESVPDIRVTVMVESGGQELLQRLLAMPLIARADKQSSDQVSVQLTDGVNLVCKIASPATYWN